MAENENVVPQQPSAHPAASADDSSPSPVPVPALGETGSSSASTTTQPAISGLKQDIALGAALLALTLCSVMAVILPQRNSDNQLPQVLIYNADLVAEQSRPFLMAGFDGPAVIRQAFDAAVSEGHVIIRASDEIAAPASALFKIEDFVTVPSVEKSK